MRSLFFFVLMLTSSLAQSKMVVVDPWIRATPMGAKVAAGYLLIENQGQENDRLLRLSSLMAAQSELHEMRHANGVMQMRELKQGLEIKAGEKLALKPGGFHLMFLDLKMPIKPNEKHIIELTFEKGGVMKVEFPVRAMGASSHTH